MGAGVPPDPHANRPSNPARRFRVARGSTCRNERRDRVQARSAQLYERTFQAATFPRGLATLAVETRWRLARSFYPRSASPCCGVRTDFSTVALPRHRSRSWTRVHTYGPVCILSVHVQTEGTGRAICAHRLCRRGDRLESRDILPADLGLLERRIWRGLSPWRHDSIGLSFRCSAHDWSMSCAAETSRPAVVSGASTSHIDTTRLGSVSADFPPRVRNPGRLLIPRRLHRE